MAVARRMSACLVALVLAGCDRGEPTPDAEFREAGTCGDGIVDPEEACDLGFANRPDGPCRACRLPACGDGIVDPGESCDDANAADDDGCRADCTPTLPQAWTRTFDTAIRDESIADLLVDPSGDVFVTGQRERDERASAWIARVAATGEPRWSLDLPPQARAATAAAIARRDDGDLVVVGTLARTDDEESEPFYAIVSEHGELATLQAVADTIGTATAVATAGDAIAIAIASELHQGIVQRYDAGGEIGWEVARAAPPAVDARALVLTPAGDVIAGGSSRGGIAGWIDRIAGDGTVVWSFDATGGAVEDLAFDATSVVASITEVVIADDPSTPSTWITAIRVLALDANDGTLRWSQSFGGGTPGRWQAGGVIVGDHDAIVVGSEPMPGSPCSPFLCESHPWIAKLIKSSGVPQVAFAWRDVERGRAHAVGVDPQGRIVIGGDVQRLFARPDAWLAVHRAEGP